MAGPEQKLVSDAADMAKAFASQYYDTFDNRRSELGALYDKDAQLTWCGNAIRGVEAMNGFWVALPQSKHTTEVLEVQPSAALPNQLVMLVVTKGNVRFGSDVPKQFSQNFLLTNSTGAWMIQSECFRLM